jgi:hypothetical protein
MSSNPAGTHVSDETSHQTRFDRSDSDGVWTAIVRATAGLADASPVELEPLYETIDTDALEAFVRSADESARLEFVYEGFSVTVSGDGTVLVSPEPDSR